MATIWADWYQEYAKKTALTKLTIVGGLLAYAGGGMLYTRIRPEIMGTRATAVLLDRYIGCTLVRVKSRARTEHPMPCPEAEQMQEAEQSAGVTGSDKIGVRRDDMARLQFTLPDASVHEARVAEHKVRSSGVPLQGRLPVVFDRSTPDDVRAPIEAKEVAIRLGILAFGLLLLAFPAVSALNWLRRGRDTSEPFVPERRQGGPVTAARAGQQTAQAVRQPTVQPARLAAVVRRGSVVGPAGARRTNSGTMG